MNKGIAELFVIFAVAFLGVFAIPVVNSVETHTSPTPTGSPTPTSSPMSSPEAEVSPTPSATTFESNTDNSHVKVTNGGGKVEVSVTTEGDSDVSVHSSVNTESHATVVENGKIIYRY